MRSLIAFVEGNAGGGEPVAAPAPTGVIDEYQLAVIPAVPGRRGKPLFGGLGRGMELRLTGSRRLGNGNMPLCRQPPAWRQWQMGSFGKVSSDVLHGALLPPICWCRGPCSPAPV